MTLLDTGYVRTDWPSMERWLQDANTYLRRTKDRLRQDHPYLWSEIPPADRGPIYVPPGQPPLPGPTMWMALEPFGEENWEVGEMLRLVSFEPSDSPNSVFIARCEAAERPSTHLIRQVGTREHMYPRKKGTGTILVEVVENCDADGCASQDAVIQRNQARLLSAQCREAFQQEVAERCSEVCLAHGWHLPVSTAEDAFVDVFVDKIARDPINPLQRWGNETSRIKDRRIDDLRRAGASMNDAVDQVYDVDYRPDPASGITLAQFRAGKRKNYSERFRARCGRTIDRFEPGQRELIDQQISKNWVRDAVRAWPYRMRKLLLAVEVDRVLAAKRTSLDRLRQELSQRGGPGDAQAVSQALALRQAHSVGWDGEAVDRFEVLNPELYEACWNRRVSSELADRLYVAVAEMEASRNSTELLEYLHFRNGMRAALQASTSRTSSECAVLADEVATCRVLMRVFILVRPAARRLVDGDITRSDLDQLLESAIHQARTLMCENSASDDT